MRRSQVRESEDLRIGHPTLSPDPPDHSPLLALTKYGKIAKRLHIHAMLFRTPSHPDEANQSQTTYSPAPAQPLCKSKNRPVCQSLGENCSDEACTAPTPLSPALFPLCELYPSILAKLAWHHLTMAPTMATNNLIQRLLTRSFLCFLCFLYTSLYISCVYVGHKVLMTACKLLLPTTNLKL